MTHAVTLDAPILPPADGGDVEKLRLLLERKESAGERDGDRGGDQQRDEAPVLGTEGLLAFLDTRPAEIEAPAAPHEIDALADRLAERILVGQREDGANELRLTLKEGPFGAAEIRIARVDGTIQVQVAADLPADTLRARGDALATALAPRLDAPVVVAVQQGGFDHSDSRGRSRGHEAILQYLANQR